MAAVSTPKSLVLVLCFSVLLTAIAAGRPAPRAGTGGVVDEKKGKDCLIQEGTVLIPGIGRYGLGTHEMPPNFTDLDHSGQAAASGQYLPGNDDTFVPNPGFEVPNPANAAAARSVAVHP